MEARCTLPPVAWHNFCTSFAKFMTSGRCYVGNICPFFHFHTVQQIRDGQSCCSVQKTFDRGTISISFLSLLSSPHPYDPLGVSAKYIPPYFISIPPLCLFSFSLASQPLQSHLNTYDSSSIHPFFSLLSFSFPSPLYSLIYILYILPHFSTVLQSPRFLYSSDI